MSATHHLKNPKISVVIAAYNEAPRIANVLKVVENHPLIDEIIVVNDGSVDDTSKVVKKFNVTLIENKKNVGKTISVKKGVEIAKNDLIMLLDADLKGLTNKSIIDLAEPVLNGRVDWTLSMRGNTFKIIKLLKVDCLSGERVVPKALLFDPIIWSKPDVGYALESLMNKSLLGKNKTFESVYFRNVTNVIKADKVGHLIGWYKDIQMDIQISKVTSVRYFFGQFITMAYLNRKYSRR
jgi:glycosyltransferase involved in cell wall biosynthesis